MEFIIKDDSDKIIKQQTKLSFQGINESYAKYDSYTYIENEVLMDRPIYLGFAILELSNLIMNETYYDKLQRSFGQNKIQLRFMDTDSFVSSRTTVCIIEDLKNLEEYLISAV